MLQRLLHDLKCTLDYDSFVMSEAKASGCKLGLFQDADVARDLTDTESTSGGMLCIFGEHICANFMGMQETDGSITHSSTAAEVISLDAGLRVEGLPDVTLWDVVTDFVEHLSVHQGETAATQTKQVQIHAGPH